MKIKIGTILEIVVTRTPEPLRTGTQYEAECLRRQQNLYEGKRNF